MASLVSVNRNVLAVSESYTYGTDTAIRIEGFETHFAFDPSDTQYALSVVEFTPALGITIGPVRYNTMTRMLADVTIENTCPLGFKTVTITSPMTSGPPEVVTLADAVEVVGATTPRIKRVYPIRGLQGANVLLAIEGAYTHFVNGFSHAILTPAAGITINSTTVSDPTHCVADITIDKDCVLGYKDVDVWNI